MLLARLTTTSKSLSAIKEEHAGKGGHLPLVLFPDGSYLFDPTLSQLGEKLGKKPTYGAQTFSRSSDVDIASTDTEAIWRWSVVRRLER